MTVFISPLAGAMLNWLGAIGVLFIVLSAVAGLMIVRSAAKEWQSGANGHRVRIIAVPPGEAPQWVREKWVGLELPLAQGFAGAQSRYASGVLTGPRGVLAELGRLVGGRLHKQSGFAVNVLEAVAILERASPEAAQWWRTNAAHMMKPSRRFLFAEEACTVIQASKMS